MYFWVGGVGRSIAVGLPQSITPKNNHTNARQTAVATNPENEVLWHAWGVAEKRDGNFGVARKLLRKVCMCTARRVVGGCGVSHL